MTILEGGFDYFVSMLKPANFRHQRADTQLRHKVVLETIERVIDSVDSKLRLIVGYKRKLKHAVESSLDYIDELVDRIPGPIAINSHTFNSDPQVNAFFVNPQDIRLKFSRSQELREFIEEHKGGDCEEIFALLCMEKKEKTVYGVELDGEILRRDVPQVAVSFTDHQLLSPAFTEAQVREGLKHCIFDGLVAEAVERLKSIQAKIDKLQDEKRRLRIMLRSAQATKNTASSVSGSTQLKKVQLEKMLVENESALIKIKSQLSSPEDTIKQVNSILEHPGKFIDIENIDLKISKLGIKLEDASEESANNIHLAQISFGGAPSRVVLLARYPCNEILPRQHFLERVDRYLRY